MPKIATIRLDRVHYMPKILEPGVLYFSEEFDSALHLCACGCGAKISTPIGAVEWTIEESDNGPTLFPSIGNWQQPCNSHYWIRDGQIIWSHQWTHEQIAAGRRMEESRRSVYYDSNEEKPAGALLRLWRWFTNFFD